MRTFSEIERVVVWFSCGATSAVAAKLALKRYKKVLPVEIVYTDTGSEHPDNQRFLKDCEKWFDHEVKILKSKDYQNIWEVFEKTRYLVGIAGATCTTVLKKKLRHSFERVWSDLQVFGFHSEETHRADLFRANNPEVFLWTPLIEENLDHADCVSMIDAAGIEVPVMYRMGYNNNNCIGCVKGQAGYWGKIRKDFPDVFNRMAKLERDIGAAICKTYAGDGERKRLFLDELPEGIEKDYDKEPTISCGVLCEATLNTLEEYCTDDSPVILERTLLTGEKQGG